MKSKAEEEEISIPLDAVIEVLSRLPPRSLMRFKSVSKHWFSLITDPIFVKLHQTHSYARQDGASLVLPPRYYSLDHPFLVIDATEKPTTRPIIHRPYVPTSPDTVTNIVNGLVCFYHQRYNGCIYVYNLTTRQYLPLSPTRGGNKCSSTHFFTRRCRLGFDPTKNEYKVLHLWAAHSSLVQCEVFTIGDKYGIWRQIDISWLTIQQVGLPSFCFDGVLYWTRQYYHDGGIIAFNVEHEKFDLINYPQEELSGEILTQFGGRVTLVGINTTFNVEITFWRLMEWTDGDVPLWSKQVIVCPFSSGMGEIRCSHSGKVYSMRSSVSNRFIIDSYDPETGEYMELEVENVEGILGLNYGFTPIKVVDNIIPLKNLIARDMPPICELYFLTWAREIGFPQLNIATDN